MRSLVLRHVVKHGLLCLLVGLTTSASEAVGTGSDSILDGVGKEVNKRIGDYCTDGKIDKAMEFEAKVHSLGYFKGKSSSDLKDALISKGIDVKGYFEQSDYKGIVDCIELVEVKESDIEETEKMIGDIMLGASAIVMSTAFCFGCCFVPVVAASDTLTNGVSQE